MSCQTCSSELTPLSLRSAYITPCCSSPICDNCLIRNPRLKEYMPCLRCGDPRSEELRGGSSRYRVRIDRTCVGNETRNAGGHIAQGAGEVVFDIGDDDDNDFDDTPQRQKDDLPPKYADISNTNFVINDEPPNRSDVHAVANSQQSDPLRPYDTSDLAEDDKGEQVEQEGAEDESEVVEVTHKVQKGDTVLSIARKYASDPHDILSLNNLPFEALSTHPRILRTRKSIIISRRSVPLSKIHQSTIRSRNAIRDGDGDVHAGSEQKARDREREREREREQQRQIKKFQLLTKNTDHGIANTYLGLSELEESFDPLRHSTGESLPEVSVSGIGSESGKKIRIDNLTREQRALEAFFDDELWESQHLTQLSKLNNNKKMSNSNSASDSKAKRSLVNCMGGIKI